MEPERLFGLDTIINKVKKGVTGVVNVAKDVATKTGSIVYSPQFLLRYLTLLNQE